MLIITFTLEISSIIVLIDGQNAINAKDKASVIVFRQKAAHQQYLIKGADRSIVAIIKEENAKDIVELMHRLILTS
ncbi:MAG: hypothetical protein GKC53_03950 [Neisseriaceae bacterium]|nr:MAG: hypothetical protein GKC53_03950 [Neisseriaceae bacterium]